MKRKLVWLGRHSYLFMYNFNNYVDTQYNGKIDIPIIDDFICQQNTCWSRLGVIDILAATLNISEQQRADLRSWYERHLAAYNESIASVFYIDKSNCTYFLDYLLGRYKGHYYRNRHPGISFV